jgi:hypothetical protein
MPDQQINNYVQTTLSVGCTNVATAITLTSAAGLPTVGNFRLQINDVAPATTFEIVEVTAMAGAVATVVRGQEGTTGIAHNAGAIVGNNITAGMLVLAFPRGTLSGGYAQVIANQTGITTISDLTNLTVTVTVGAGRRIRITAYVRVGQNTSLGAPNVLYIREGAVTLATSTVHVAAGQYYQHHAVVVLQPSAAAHTYKLSLSTTAGTTDLISGGSADPSFILVEDVGV